LLNVLLQIANKNGIKKSEDEKDPVSEMLCFLVFGIPNCG
jgi:hypothetical protein